MRGHIIDLQSDFPELVALSYIDVELLNARLLALNLAPL